MVKEKKKSKAGKVIGLTIFILSMLVLPIICGLAHNWPLMWTFIIFYICFGATEIISKVKTGRTVTQWTTALPKKWLYSIIASMVVMWGMLIAHFLKINPFNF